jgi:hypothetical protein
MREEKYKRVRQRRERMHSEWVTIWRKYAQRQWEEVRLKEAEKRRLSEEASARLKLLNEEGERQRHGR